MDDYIKRDDAIRWNPASKDRREYGTFNLDDAYETGYEDKIKQIEQIPSADVVKVVRCRDCKYWNANLKQCFHKSAPGMWRKETFFCANGERKTNG